MTNWILTISNRGVQWIDLFFGEFITGNMKAGWWLTYPSEKSWSSSIGMIISHIFWKIKFMFQTTNQILWFSYGFPMIIRGFYENNGVFYHSLRCLRSSFRFGESGSAMFSRTKPQLAYTKQLWPYKSVITGDFSGMRNIL